MAKLYKGIDMSFYQGKADFNAMRDAGVDFVMLKASQGRTVEYDAPFSDPEFENNVLATVRAQKNGVFYAGAYHYLCARNVSEAEAEAEYFISLVKKYRFNLQLWAAVDVEDPVFLPDDRESLSEIVRVFCEKVKEAGLRPMVYANTWWLDNRFTPPEGVPIWEANWGAPQMPERSRMWQYTAQGTVRGIQGDVDMNLAYDIMGDVNRDGKVNLKDAALMIRHAAGWRSDIDESQGDFDRDGYVTLKDAVQLIRRLS